MEQREFSKLILKFLEGNYPQFAQTIKFQDDESFDCYLKSESGIFSIWIATYNTEITIGIEDPNGETDIHSHIPCYGLDDLGACVAELSSFIENIKADNLVLYQDEDGKYNLIGSFEFENLDNCKKFSWKINHDVTE
ncbi:MAG: hypothetical protein K0S24_2576 [Sphingobacterium sp.]|jgi:hypothetical protein|nr:hypothetical protein [Sphingobacterium sp.]